MDGFIGLHFIASYAVTLRGVAPYGKNWFDVGFHRTPLHYVLCCYMAGRCPFWLQVLKGRYVTAQGGVKRNPVKKK
jgi:hypothetical protein